METKFLLPNRYKRMGWITLVISIALWVYVALILKKDIPYLDTTTFAIFSGDFIEDAKYMSLIKVNMTNTLIGFLFIIGGLIVVFTKERIEDELISKLRLISFQWSFLINYLLLLFLFIFIYGLQFLNVMIYNMFTTIIIFIIHFQYSLYKYKNMDYEK